MWNTKLPLTVSVKRLTQTPNAYMGTTNTWSTVITDLKCRIEKYSGNLTFEQSGSFKEFSHFMMCSIELQEEDIVVYGSTNLKVKRCEPIPDDIGIDHYEIYLDETEEGN